jgi:hypothetical protein
MSINPHSKATTHYRYEPVKKTAITHLSSRLKTCLHFYIASAPWGTLFCFALLLPTLFGASHEGNRVSMLPMAVYALGCLVVFCATSPRALHSIQELEGPIRWYRIDRAFALMTNAAYPLAVVASILPFIAKGPQAAYALNFLSWHIALSCFLRDGFGTAQTIAKNLEVPE